jgi:hypothetical protein
MEGPQHGPRRTSCCLNYLVRFGTRRLKEAEDAISSIPGGISVFFLYNCKIFKALYVQRKDIRALTSPHCKSIYNNNTII